MKKLAALSIILLSTSLYCFSRFQMPQWGQYFNNKNIKSAINYTKNHPYFSTTLVGASVLSAMLSHKYNIPRNYYIPAIALSNAALLYGKRYFDSKQTSKAIPIEDFIPIETKEPLTKKQLAEKNQINDIIKSAVDTNEEKIEKLNALKEEYERSSQGTGSSDHTQKDSDFSNKMVWLINDAIFTLNEQPSNESRSHEEAE